MLGNTDSLPGPGHNQPFACEIGILSGDDLIQRTLAFTADLSIGYAAFRAAREEFPDAVVGLRHQGRILARSA